MLGLLLIYSFVANAEQGDRYDKSIKGLSVQTFDALSGELGMSPEQIKAIKRKLKNKDAALRIDETIPKIFTSKMLYVSTKPGAQSRAINLQKGVSVSIEFQDQSGNPWNVVDFSKKSELVEVFKPKLGAETDFNSVISITPQNFGRGNKLIYLEGMTTPLSLVFHVGINETKHDRYQLVVMERSQKEKKDISEGNRQRNENAIFEDPLMLDVLSGVTPLGYKKIVFDANITKSIGFKELDFFEPKSESGKYLFIRTSGDIIAPSPINVAKNGQMRAFKINALPIIALRNDFGEELDINIENLKSE